jgi:hypothetical protein
MPSALIEIRTGERAARALAALLVQWAYSVRISPERYLVRLEARGERLLTAQQGEVIRVYLGALGVAVYELRQAETAVAVEEEYRTGELEFDGVSAVRRIERWP